REARAWPYTYDHFDNGVGVPDLARKIYLGLGRGAERFGDPLSASGPTSYFRWLNESVDAPEDPPRPVTRLWYDIYQRRADLPLAFPDLFGSQREAFLEWQVRHGSAELAIPPRFLAHKSSRDPRPGQA